MFGFLKKLFKGVAPQERKYHTELELPVPIAKPVKVRKLSIPNLTRRMQRRAVRMKFWTKAFRKDYDTSHWSKRMAEWDQRSTKRASNQIVEICAYYDINRATANRVYKRTQSIQAVRRAGRQAGLHRPIQTP